MEYETLILQMTLEEKCSLLSGGTQFTTKTIERLGIHPIFLSDGPHGIRKQAGAADHLGLNPSMPATCYPVAATMANSWNVELAKEVGEYLGEEARSLGVNVLLGPGMNLKRNPLCGRNFEYFSEDPYLTGKMAAAYIQGIQTKGIAACPKHFAVNSQETFRMANNSILDERTLRELYLTGFEIAVKEGKPKTIMTSYNQINGEYANDSEKLLKDILVDEWGFDGIVVTDWGGSNERVQGLIAGNHLEMPATKGNSDREIIEAVRAGRISEEFVNQRVKELLSVWMDVMLPDDNPPFPEKEHHEFARKAAEDSIVLLQNQDQILPIKEGTKVAVIGDFAKLPRYQGAGSSLVNVTQLDIPVEEIIKSGFAYVGFAKGFERDGKEDEGKAREAIALAKEAEVVLLYLGLDEIAEVEGMERKHMCLHQNQTDLLKRISHINKNIVVILSAGASLEMPWSIYAKAIVHGYLGGQAGAGAMVNVLAGRVNPSGKLAETYPLKYEDVPSAGIYPGTGCTSEYREGLYVGYRYYEKTKKDVKYPFGFGLSYSQFEYKDLKVTEDEVIFQIQNISEVAGAEIAQLYVSSKQEAIFSPVKELKGFTKIFLKPGESKEVRITIDDKAFRYFNVKTNRFEIIGGQYQILIGASSTDIRLMASVTKTGTDAEVPYDKAKIPTYFSGAVKGVPEREFIELLGRSLPASGWDRNAPIQRNQPIACLKFARNPIARFVFWIIHNKKIKSEKKGKPDLNILFIYNMPFRGISKMMGGMVDIKMVDAMLTIVNGQFFKGCGQLIKAYRRMKKGQRGGIV